MPPDGSSSKSSASTDRARVLVVDDDEAVLRVFGRQLTGAGYAVDLSQDSRAALTRLNTEPYDLVICDVEMPWMTGTELLAQLRGSRNDVPFVLITGNPQLHSAVKAVEHGVVRYLTKPIDTRTLAQVAGEAVRVHGLARAEQLARDNEALRSLVEELNRSRNAAEAALRAKTLFLHAMSDELRTPLVGVLGLTELVLDGDLSDEQRENLEAVRQSASVLLGRIQNVIDAANLTQGKTRLVNSTFRVREVIEGIVHAHEAAARTKGLVMTLAFEPDVPELLHGEGVKLGQIIRNLVDNALKFTKRGEVKVHVGVRPDAARGVGLVLSVTDTGIGIANELLPTIFEPFVQGDPSLARAHKGSGLGLAIASQLATLMGGELAVAESTPGVGSKLRLTVPFALGAA